jgi:hypothetical protein
MAFDDPYGPRPSGWPPVALPGRLPRGALVRIHPKERTDLADLARQCRRVAGMLPAGEAGFLDPGVEPQRALAGRFTGWASSQGLQYASTGPGGEPRVLSARVYLPTFWRRGPAEVPLVVLVHGAELAREAVPFFNQGPEAVLGALAAYLCGFVVAMPDLPGLGLDPSPRPHPCCHARSLADAILDLVPAALASLDSTRFHWDGRLFLAGYSAGAYGALAAVRAAQEDPAYTGPPVTAAACMGGPFQFHEAVRGWILDTGTPYSRPYLQTCLIHAYHDLYRPTGLFEPRLALHPALLEHRRQGGLDDGNLLTWLNGCLPGAAISPRIRLRLKGDPEAPLAAHEVLNPPWVRAQFRDPAWPETPVGRILRENDLAAGWSPRAPMLLAASPADECVAIRNSEALLSEWRRRDPAVRVTFRHLTWRGVGLDHVQAGLMALVQALWWFRTGGV